MEIIGAAALVIIVFFLLQQLKKFEGRQKEIRTNELESFKNQIRLAFNKLTEENKNLFMTYSPIQLISKDFLEKEYNEYVKAGNFMDLSIKDFQHLILDFGWFFIYYSMLINKYGNKEELLRKVLKTSEVDGTLLFCGDFINNL